MSDPPRSIVDAGFPLRVLSHYMRLTAAIPEDTREPDLGGTLLYAGELDEAGRAVIVASNIAGAASLCAAANADAQKQAIRDGIVDFLVTSLDEGLRILKNEIRKHAPVAVCVAGLPAEIESQMKERGVAPDLLRPVDEGSYAGPMTQTRSGLEDDYALVGWSVSSAASRWMPKLDALALECLDKRAGHAHRWLRLAPRYLGRLAQETHLVYADRPFARRFIERVKDLGEISIPLKVQVSDRHGCEELGDWNSQPAAPPE